MLLCFYVKILYYSIYTYLHTKICMYMCPEPQSHSIPTKKQVSGLNASTKKLCSKSSVKYD